jgi:competence protein ComFC
VSAPKSAIAPQSVGRWASPWVAWAWDAALDWIFPPRCVNCGRVDAWWCSSCVTELSSLPLNPAAYPLEYFAATLSTGPHTGLLQNAVQALKYYGLTDLAPVLGARLAAVYPLLNMPIDLIVPVPLFNVRLMERGYNQSQILCAALAEQIGIPTSDALTRERDTGSQVGLNREERLSNVESAFKADAAQVAGKQLLIVDDVRTTGATLKACAQAALSAGAGAVYALTLSRAE